MDNKKTTDLPIREYGEILAEMKESEVNRCEHCWGKIEEHACGYDCTAIEYLSQACEKCGLARTVKGVCDHSWGKIEEYTSHIAVETDLTLTYQQCKRCGEIKEIDKTFW